MIIFNNKGNKSENAINKYKIGDLVTIIKVPPDLTDDLELKTKKVFEICFGKTYAIQGFNQYGHLELAVGKDVDNIVGGFMNTIWIEPEYVIPANIKPRHDQG